MKIVIAPDKFKGVLSGLEFCEIVEHEILKHCPSYQVIKLPLADGGDGTVNVLQYYLGGQWLDAEVYSPIMQKIKARYLFANKSKTSYIEMAEASGLRLLPYQKRNPMHTTTYGTGELIRSAIENGAKQIILGVGGSSTNDAGMGMARALGYKFIDNHGEELLGFGKDLNFLSYIDDSNVLPELKNIKFTVACDVENSLFGKNGASFVYGKQKGADLKMQQELDYGLMNFNYVIKQKYGISLQEIKGAGAAGGLAAGAKVFLNAQLQSGISLIKEISNFSEQIQNTDWIITGEGRLDEQTFLGKVIKGIIDELTTQKLAVFCGVSHINGTMLQQHKISYLAELSKLSSTPSDSMNNAQKYLLQATREFASKNI